MIKKKCMCDNCLKEEVINPNWGLPNDWLKVSIIINAEDIIDKDFCTKKCLESYLDKHNL